MRGSNLNRTGRLRDWSGTDNKNGVDGDDVDDYIVVVVVIIIIVIIIIIWYLLTRCLSNTSACYKTSTERNATQKQYKYTKIKQQQ